MTEILAESLLVLFEFFLRHKQVEVDGVQEDFLKVVQFLFGDAPQVRHSTVGVKGVIIELVDNKHSGDNNSITIKQSVNEIGVFEEKTRTER